VGTLFPKKARAREWLAPNNSKQSLAASAGGTISVFSC